MRRLRFQEMLLLSRQEKAARRVALDPSVTTIRGNNDTGKSSLLKSIYATFGATAAVVPASWQSADPISLVRFTVDEVPYAMLRANAFYAVFDGNDRVLLATDSVLTGVGPFLADLLEYKIALTSAQGASVPPPPQHFFLPFYIDQDEGWTANWSSFSLLTQVRDWRRSIVEFHTGLRPNEYYVAKARLAAAQSKLRQARSEVTVLERMVAEVRQDTVPTFDVDIEAFQAQLRDLLEECNRLKEVEELLSSRLNELYSRRYTLQTQLGVAEASLTEVSQDYQFATEEVPQSEVECPTCGAVYSNSFAERFAIAQDEDRISDLILHLRSELVAVETEIAAASAEHSNKRSDIQRISALLDERQGEVTIGTLIQSEGKKEVNTLLRTKMDGARERVTRDDAAVSDLKAKLKDFDDPDRRERILGQYRSLMRSYLHELKVFRLREPSYRQIAANITETGSDLPRALLAYYFSILNVIAEHSTSAFCPIVIDSPNQQGQDRESLASMLRFIRDRRPPKSQLILAIEEPLDVDFGGSTVELTTNYRVLRPDEYETVSEIITPLLTKALR